MHIPENLQPSHLSELNDQERWHIFQFRWQNPNRIYLRQNNTEVIL